MKRTLSAAATVVAGAALALVPVSPASAADVSLRSNCNGGTYGASLAQIYCTYGYNYVCFQVSVGWSYQGGSFSGQGDWRRNAGGTWSGKSFGSGVTINWVRDNQTPNAAFC